MATSTTGPQIWVPSILHDESAALNLKFVAMASILLAGVVGIAIPLIRKNRSFLRTNGSLLPLASSNRSGSSFNSYGFFWVRLPFHKLTIKVLLTPACLRSVPIAEAVALRNSLLCAKDRGFRKVEVEGDWKLVIDVVNEDAFPP
ncbi:hypothetical protein ACLB2K_069432 [Fragaria x ananassa]